MVSLRKKEKILDKWWVTSATAFLAQFWQRAASLLLCEKSWHWWTRTPFCCSFQYKLAMVWFHWQDSKSMIKFHDYKCFLKRNFNTLKKHDSENFTVMYWCNMLTWCCGELKLCDLWLEKWITLFVKQTYFSLLLIVSRLICSTNWAVNKLSLQSCIQRTEKR